MYVPVLEASCGGGMGFLFWLNVQSGGITASQVWARIPVPWLIPSPEGSE
jgi:hypothetical protein